MGVNYSATLLEIGVYLLHKAAKSRNGIGRTNLSVGGGVAATVSRVYAGTGKKGWIEVDSVEAEFLGKTLNSFGEIVGILTLEADNVVALIRLSVPAAAVKSGLENAERVTVFREIERKGRKLIS